VKFSSTDKKILKPVYNFVKTRGVKLYLVGGILRDILLGREKENLDFDFCLKRGSLSFGKKLAGEIKAGFVVLDKEHGACRLVKKTKGKIYTLDFTDFRGKTLEKDLLLRDFTINAIALELDKVFAKGHLDDFLIDPYNGRVDLKHKIIRVVNKKAFVEDPLRILRSFSFSSIFGFKIDKQTLKLAKLYKHKLSRVSYERIRDELFKIFDNPNTFDYLIKLDKMRILTIPFPEIEKMRRVKQGPYHHLDIWQHSLETVRQLELLAKQLKNKQDIQNYLNEVLSSQRRRFALMKLGALLHDIGKPQALRREEGKIKFHGHEKIGTEITKEIAKRLKLSNDELDSLGKMIFCHLRPGYLADSKSVSKRAAFRYFRDTAKDAVSTLLISIADQRSTRGRLTTAESRIQHEKICFGLIKEYFKKQKEKKLPRLISGDDLINKFKLEPSLLIGKILREIEELQAIGKIKTRQKALELAKKIISSK
jgi:poly(A) polymerase